MSMQAVSPHPPKAVDNPYMPHMARIVRIHRMVPDNYLFQVRFADDAVVQKWDHRPGQFVELSVIGTGEAPISISSSPTRKGILEFCIRRAGRVTSALYKLPTNALVGIRGPYGNGFPVEEMAGHDLLIIAGGLGSIVMQALAWVKAGWDADRIVTGIENMSARNRTYFLVDTLEYLQKGGRIGGASALIGTVLQIKPILTIRNGLVQPFEKIRTKAAALTRFKELVEKECPRNAEAWLSVSHCSTLAAATELAEGFKSAYGYKDVPIYEVPPAIVVHGGPSILSVSFFVERN